MSRIAIYTRINPERLEDKRVVYKELVKMPKYRKKITRLMDYKEFKSRIKKYQAENIIFPDMDKAFLSILFFIGCRVSEALSIESKDISCTKETIFIQIHRLKGSKQTYPSEVPNIDYLKWVCSQEGKLFPFSRYSANRLIKNIFPDLYAHYFRMNRIVMIAEKHGDNTVYATFGICAQSIDHYRSMLGIKKVRQTMNEEIEKEK